MTNYRHFDLKTVFFFTKGYTTLAVYIYIYIYIYIIIIIIMSCW